MRKLLVVRFGAVILLVGVWAFSPRLRHEARSALTARRYEATATDLAARLRDGDLIFQTSTSAQSRAIRFATHSPYSHCGLLFRQNGTWQVFEAVQPVKSTPLAAWIARGQGGHFAVKRLRDAETALTPAALRRLRQAGEALQGRNYDLYFGWSDERVYCSELIWKVYARGLGRHLGALQRLGDFDLRHPAVQAKLRERYGRRLPLQEPVISPARLFDSPELVLVARR